MEIVSLDKLIFLCALIGAAILLHWAASWITPKVVRLLGRYSDQFEEDEKVYALRRLETFVGIGASLVKLLIVVGTIYLAWRTLLPETAGAALLGASAFIAIIAGSILGPLLRDITAGTLMIAEHWYHVGDHITIEPYSLSGVVEQLTPRATKLRALSGEAILVHNQHIIGVRVIRRGVRTIALDIFVNNLEAGQEVLANAIQALPTGPTMVARQLTVGEVEQLADKLWRITATAQTTPGREWLLEDFAIKAILKYDAERPDGPVIMHGPIASYSDALAERRFRRMVRTKAN